MAEPIGSGGGLAMGCRSVDPYNAPPEEYSLHLTVGAIVYTWSEFILELIAEVILRGENARAALPAGLLAGAQSLEEGRRAYVRLIGSIGRFSLSS